MAKDRPRNLAASVRQRLLNHATASKVDPNLLLIWYALERLLYRLSVSKHRDQFVVKGALLFRVWGGPDFRATKDLDLLGFVRQEIGLLREFFTAVCAQSTGTGGLPPDQSEAPRHELPVMELGCHL